MFVRHDVGAERARLQRPRVVAGRAEHDPAAGRPRQLGVMHVVALAVDRGLVEPHDVDEEADERAGVAGAQGGPCLHCTREFNGDANRRRSARGPLR